MAMTTMVTGKMYNGKVYKWKDKSKNERTMFRGRLNYRDRTNGDWYFVDVVCWKDFGDTGGLVAFLDKHFSANSDNAPADKGGQPVEIVGYFEAIKSIIPFEVKGKTLSKTFDVEYPTFQLVIETADFPPNNEKRGKANASASVDDDFDFDEEEEDFDIEEDEDDVDVDIDDEDEDEEEEEVVETKAERTARLKAEKIAKAKAEKARLAKAEKARLAKERKKQKVSEDDDEEFFRK